MPDPSHRCEVCNRTWVYSVCLDDPSVCTGMSLPCPACMPRGSAKYISNIVWQYIDEDNVQTAIDGAW